MTIIWPYCPGSPIKTSASLGGGITSLGGLSAGLQAEKRRQSRNIRGTKCFTEEYM